MQKHYRRNNPSMPLRLLSALALGLAVFGAGTSHLSAQTNEGNSGSVALNQNGGTVFGSYSLDTQGYTQITTITMQVVTASAGVPGPSSGNIYSTSANGWGHSDNLQWTSGSACTMVEELQFRNLTRNSVTGVWTAGAVYYSSSYTGINFDGSSCVLDTGGSLSYPNGAAFNQLFGGVTTNEPESNSFSATGSFTLGTVLNWTLGAQGGNTSAVPSNFTFQVIANTGSPIITPLASPTVSWGSTPPATVYPGANLAWSANASDPNGVALSAVQLHFDLSTNGGAYTGEAYQWASNPNANSFTAGGVGTTYTMRATVNDGVYPSGAPAFVGAIFNTVTVVAIPTTFTVAPVSLTYTGSAQGPAISPSPANATYSTSGTASATSAGSYSLTATANGNYTGTSGVQSWTIAKANAVVTWGTPAAITYGTALSSAQLNATANVPGTFAYSPAAGTVLSAGSQALSVTFTPTDGTDYNTATATVSLGVNPASATFTIAPTLFTYSGAAQGPTITSNPSSATFGTSGTVSAIAAGSYSVSATANGTYTGTSGATSWTIAKATPVVAWGPPAAITYGTALSAAQLNATANVPGTFAYAPAAGTVLSAGTQTLSVTFTPTDGSDYNSATATVSLVVNPEAVSFTIAPVSFIYDGLAQGPTITPSPSGATFGTTGTTSATAAGSYTVTATANGNYTGTGGATSWTISRATPAGTLTWATPAAITYGTALSTVQLDASSTLPGSFVYSPAAGAVLNAGTQTLSVTFTPTDTTDYTSATATVSLVVNPEPVTFTVTPVSFPYNGSSQGPTVMPSVAGATFGTTGATSAISVGSYSLTASATGNYSGTSGAQGWAIAKGNPAITWAAPAAITYGTALGAAQLDATANVPGTFIYSPAAGAALNAGAQTLSVTFTPTDGTDYNTATQTVSLMVNPAPQTVAVTPASQTVQLGQAANFTASGSSTGYTWTGATGTGASATQTWGAVGTYTVVVQAPASGNYAASNTATATVTVTLKQQTVTITPNAPTLTAGQSVTLTASGGQNGYTWGGVISGSGPTQSPSFPNVGTYTVTAFSAAGNNYAQSNTASAVITVNAAGQTVSITPTNPSVQAGQSLTFTASGGFTPYVWGGQATGTGSIQTPTFGSVGTYPVTVYAQAQGNYAQSNTATALVTATTIPQTITVTPSQTTIYVNTSVTLTAAGGSTSYNWGGAASGSGATQKLSWATPGTYTVTVQAPASGNYAASNTATATITVRTTVPGIKNNSDTGTVSVQGAQVIDPNAIIPPSN